MHQLGRTGRGEIVYGADSRPTEALTDFATGADLMLVEATLPRPERTGKRGHLTPAEAGEQARAAGAKRLCSCTSPTSSTPTGPAARPRRRSAARSRWRERGRDCSRYERLDKGGRWRASAQTQHLAKARRPRRDLRHLRARRRRPAVGHRARRARGAARARGAQPARGRAQAGRPAARPVGHAPARRDRRRRPAALHARSRRTGASRCCSPGPTAAWPSGAPPSRRCARARCSPTTAGRHNGDRNPVWDAMGYPGPLGPPAEPAAAARSSRSR